MWKKGKNPSTISMNVFAWEIVMSQIYCVVMRHLIQPLNTILDSREYTTNNKKKTNKVEFLLHSGKRYDEYKNPINRKKIFVYVKSFFVCCPWDVKRFSNIFSFSMSYILCEIMNYWNISSSVGSPLVESLTSDLSLVLWHRKIFSNSLDLPSD